VHDDVTATDDAAADDDDVDDVDVDGVSSRASIEQSPARKYPG